MSFESANLNALFCSSQFTWKLSRCIWPSTYTHPGRKLGVSGCVWLCAWSRAATSVAWHSFILFPYKRISKLPTVWEWIPTQHRTGHSNGIIILSFEWSLGKHYTLILCLKLGTDWADVQKGYHSHCAPIIQLSLLLFRWKRKRINHVESVKPCPCRSSLSLLVVVRFSGADFKYYNLCPHISVFPGLSYFKACDAFGTFNLINWFNLLGPKTTLRNMNWKSSSARLLFLVVLCGRLGLLPTTTLYSALKSYECRRHWIYYTTDLND